MRFLARATQHYPGRGIRVEDGARAPGSQGSLAALISPGKSVAQMSGLCGNKTLAESWYPQPGTDPDGPNSVNPNLFLPSLCGGEVGSGKLTRTPDS